MAWIARLAASTFLLIGAAIHLDLWRRGYRDIPSIGPLFLANVAASAAVVVGLAVRAGPWVVLGGVVVSVGSLAGLVLSRTAGLLGFVERGWSDLAVQATTAEIGAIVALALVVVVRSGRVPVPATVAVRRRSG
jgi:hypothetical protein